jgi:hypothetical protein
VSLTSHLKDPRSPIAQFIQQQFSRSISITKTVNPQLRSCNTIKPATTNTWPYDKIGTALDYRIRYSFAITPNKQLVAWHGARRFITKPWDNENDIPFDWDEVPVGESIPMPMANGQLAAVAQGPYPLKFITSFFDSLDTTLRTIQPIGRRLQQDEERVLARYCFVLALFEEVYRTGRSGDSVLMVPSPRQSLDELLAISEDAWIDDLCALSTVFYDNYHHLLTQPHVLNPTFSGSLDVGGADADLVVDGCLIDIKTSITPQIKPRYLYQLAGYLLLDYDDKLKIDSVGIYMARQGILFTWPVVEFLHLLTGNETVSLSQLRQEFQAMVKNK